LIEGLRWNSVLANPRCEDWNAELLSRACASAWKKAGKLDKLRALVEAERAKAPNSELRTPEDVALRN
jgi:hypothetical protein